MFRLPAHAAALAMLMAGPAVAATNTITIDPTVPADNLLTLGVAGSENVLALSQSAPAGTANPNLMQVSLTGDANGGAAGSFSGVALLSGLAPGHLSQAGEGNLMTLSVSGTGNLFAMAQTGSFNSIEATILGQHNQAAVIQNGIGNHLSFVQNGNGNIIKVSQTSW